MENSGIKAPVTVCENGDSDIITFSEALLRICEDGVYASIVSLVQRGANVEYTDSYGNTPLLTAIENHHINCVDVLLNNKYSLANTEHSNTVTGNTPLMMAANNFDIVRLLINSGCQLNSTNRFKDSALHLAARNENLKVVQLLVSSGIDVTLTNKDRETALHIAIIIRNPAISCRLLSIQECLDSQSVYLLDMACGYEYSNNKGDTFLQDCMEYFMKYCDRETVTQLIQHGLPVDASLLGYAYRNKDLVMVDTLIQASLHQNPDHSRFTPFIYFSLIHNDFEGVEKYIKYVSPFAALEDGRSLLDVAHYVENYDMAGILLQNGHHLTFCNCIKALNWLGYQYDRSKHGIVKIKHVIQYGIAHTYRRRTQFMPPQLHLKCYHSYVFQYINILYVMYMSNLINNNDLHCRLSKLPVPFNNHGHGKDLQNIASDLALNHSLSRDVGVASGPLEELAFGRLKSLQELALSPMSLLCITRNVICGSLGPPNMWFNVGLLPLPDKVKSFLRYDDILSNTG
ncbi:putative ankyrin repeat protein RF_0381 [Patella vulgata]|uniref:putative ankyrin repeat protein RF_0381 n=1 Tax=Patella vulgata TaxID=6465 RepID=UPI00217F9AF6|nr:putative ankyrin repeat protein RF_0381 [Patella vulgata]